MPTDHAYLFPSLRAYSLRVYDSICNTLIDLQNQLRMMLMGSLRPRPGEDYFLTWMVRTKPFKMYGRITNDEEHAEPTSLMSEAKRIR
jgi:hypothetical protein